MLCDFIITQRIKLFFYGNTQCWFLCPFLGVEFKIIFCLWIYVVDSAGYQFACQNLLNISCQIVSCANTENK